MKERIKKLRKSLDLTQQQFADKIGVKRNTVGQWECGINALTDQTVTAICREFNVNEDWLRNGTGEMFVELDIEGQLIEWAGKALNGRDANFKRRFITMLMNLSEKEWEFIEKKALELVGDEAAPSSLQDLPQTSEELLNELTVKTPHKAM